ncbi:MAG TPA: hypothetical protein VIL49_18425 [Capillimicrobium sp.]|jgi:hypothetical protein
MELTIRFANDADRGAVGVLAAVDSQAVPSGPLLLAEVDGELWAAESLSGGGSVADPFRPTADVRQVLRERARQLAAAPVPTRRPRALLGLRRRAIASP